jgi:hypothetical protein
MNHRPTQANANNGISFVRFVEVAKYGREKVR